MRVKAQHLKAFGMLLQNRYFSWQCLWLLQIPALAQATLTPGDRVGWSSLELPDYTVLCPEQDPLLASFNLGDRVPISLLICFPKPWLSFLALEVNYYQ